MASAGQAEERKAGEHMSTKLQISGLTFSYENRKILNEMDFQVKEGEFVSLLGPSGCGKSTLLKLLTGVIKPEAGQILVDGEEIHGITEHFAYMPQNDLLFPWKTILENVCLYARIHGGVEEMRKAATDQMESFGLKGYENEYPSALSGGMRQRAAFLRTLLCHADIMRLVLTDHAANCRDNIERWHQDTDDLAKGCWGNGPGGEAKVFLPILKGFV